jgi:hypothetical protein
VKKLPKMPMTATVARNTHSRPVPLRSRFGLLVLFLVSVYGFLEIRQIDFAPGSDVGYRFGLAGALMMLALLVYPLRKHVPWLRDIGRLSSWLQLHMILGICGPMFILFHSGFRISSLNAGVAMASMTIVASSGIVGRFIYGRIHSSLSGQKQAAAELNRELGKLLLDVERGGALPQRVRELLIDFETRAARQPSSVFDQTLRFLRIASERRGVLRAVRRELAHAVDARRRAQIETGLGPYLLGLQRVAQFAIFERMFALWHVLHLPLVVLLAVSAVFHVIAVHMY